MTCTHEQLEVIEERFASYEARKTANIAALYVELMNSSLDMDEIRHLVRDDDG